MTPVSVVNELCSQNNAVRCKFFVTRQTRTACEWPTDRRCWRHALQADDHTETIAVIQARVVGAKSDRRLGSFARISFSCRRAKRDDFDAFRRQRLACSTASRADLCSPSLWLCDNKPTYNATL